MHVKPPRFREPSTCAPSSLSARRDIDALYGLEPVFEPGHEEGLELGAASAFHSVRCPYCGERFDTLVDASGGAATYVEDCQICCQPIDFELQVDSDGDVGVSVRRS